MSLVCLMIGLRMPLFPHLTMTFKALLRALDLGGGGGGVIIIIIMTGKCGPNLEDPTPYSYKGQARKPYLFIYFSKRFCIYTYDSFRLYPAPNSCAVFVCQLQFKPPYTPLLYCKTGEYRVTHHPPTSALKHRPGYPLEPPFWCGSSV